MLFHRKSCAVALALGCLAIHTSSLPAAEENARSATAAEASDPAAGSADDGPPALPGFQPDASLPSGRTSRGAENLHHGDGQIVDDPDGLLPLKRRTPRLYSNHGVRPTEWEQVPTEHHPDELRSPLWAPPVPRQRPTARGRWVWLPDPSEIRGNGLFSPDAVSSPCDIGPCEAVDDAAEQPVQDFRLHGECPLCRDKRKELAPPIPEANSPGRAAGGDQPTARDLAEIAELMSRHSSVVEGSSLEGEDIDCPGHGHPACQDCRRQAALERLQKIETGVARLNPEVWVDEPLALEQQHTTEQRVADSIRVLRETSFDLDVAAQRLEEQQLYFRADQLREFASQLRQEARSALGGWSLKRLQPHAQEAPVGAERDLGLELEQLRDELHRVREALRNSSETSRR